ncbi:hypothetical protein ACFDTO_37230 [Microbacteriaceae bacterium 4G12]
MKVYYNERAHEYEKVYFREDPIRQKEQEEIRNKMGQNMKELLH